MPSKIYSVELFGLEGRLVEIEVDVRSGLPAFTMVGLPDAALQEARERVRSAMKNSGFPFPRGKVVVNLAPADLKKIGSRYDVPIALGILSLCEIIDQSRFSETLFLGELALNGAVRPITGVLPSIEFAKNKGFKKVFLPYGNVPEASLIQGIELLPLRNLQEAVLYLQGYLSPLKIEARKHTPSPPQTMDMAMIKGQNQAKRVLEIAAAGGHNLLLKGSPGAGKTMIAKALAGILPAMTEAEILEVSKIYSVAGLLKAEAAINRRPFRQVHHTASRVSMVGGGSLPMPGEVTLAHRGVLFLDEIAEFGSHSLEALRQPLEEGEIYISRARAGLRFPAEFTLVAAMNPCPCGYYKIENAQRECTCTFWKIRNYQKKLSGPLMDRIDMHLHVRPVAHSDLGEERDHENSDAVRKRVQNAADRQQKRFSALPIHKNAEMRNVDLAQFCPLDQDSKDLLEQAMTTFRLSARVYFKIIKLARTIADLEEEDEILSKHIAEALQYRNKDH